LPGPAFKSAVKPFLPG